jgi:hypothetical protein
MRGLAIGTAILGIVAAAALRLVGSAAAAPTGGSNAADAVNQLQAQGYTVQINGDKNAPLSQCITTQVSGLSGTNAAGKPLTPAQAGTVYVTVACDYE